MYWAAFSGNVNIVKLLIERGGDVAKKCPSCRSPREIANIRGYPEIEQLLSTYSPPAPKSLEGP